MPRRPAPPALVTLAARAAAPCGCAAPLPDRPPPLRRARPSPLRRRRCCSRLRRHPAAAAATPGRHWRAPVPGPVVGAFRFDAGDPYRAGQRRGIDLAAPRGAPVRSACAGVVTAAGRVPGRGLGVTVRCGELAATHLGLAGVRVRRGPARRSPARASARRLGPVVRLGARRAGRRHGYVDPAGLLGGLGPGPPPPVLAPPRGRRPPAKPRRTPAHPVRRRHALTTTRTPRRAAAAPAGLARGRAARRRAPRGRRRAARGAAPAAGARPPGRRPSRRAPAGGRGPGR